MSKLVVPAVAGMSAKPAPRRALAIALLAVLTVASGAQAETVKGRFCTISQVRVSNPESKTGVLREKIWEYKEATAPFAPLLGYLDVACADRGPTRSEYQDFGKRLWFSLSGPEGAPASAAKITLGEKALMSKVGDVGIVVVDQALFGIIQPRHDCAFAVTIWSENCPNP